MVLDHGYFVDDEDFGVPHGSSDCCFGVFQDVIQGLMEGIGVPAGESPYRLATEWQVGVL